MISIGHNANGNLSRLSLSLEFGLVFKLGSIPLLPVPQLDTTHRKQRKSLPVVVFRICELIDFYRVCAIWLFANIWFVNVLRAKMPALQFPAILYSIFTNVAFTYGPLFTTIASGEQFVKQLLEGFLTAFAISTGVSLFIIPVNSRTVVFKEQAGYVQLIRATLKAQTAYLQSLETSDMFAPEEQCDENGEDVDGSKKAKHKKTKEKDKPHPAANAQAQALKANLAALTALHGKLHGDVPFGKRETAWGKLDAKDIDEIFTLFRNILIPLIGMSTITDIFERIAERRGWVRIPNSKFDKAESWEALGQEAKEKEKKTWNEIMKTLHEPFEVVSFSHLNFQMFLAAKWSPFGGPYLLVALVILL